MAKAVILPRQGQSVESCIITTLDKNVGDTVAVGDLLFEYETDKASFQEESQLDGVVLAVFAEEGDEVPVLENLMVIGQAGESFEEFAPNGGASAEAKVVAEEAPKAEVVVEKPVATKGDSTGFISPRAKQLAQKEGLNTSAVEGSGPNGRIIERDVVAAVASQPKVTPLAKKVAAAESLPIAEAGSGLGGAVKAADLTATNPVYGEDSFVEKMPNIRKLIAKAMHASLQNSAQLTHHLGADARQMMSMRKKVKAALADGYQHNLTLNDMVCYAVIQTLSKYPNVNAHFLGDAVRKFNKVHLGLAVDTERGLMVPTIKNADDLSIQGLSSQIKTVANACKTGRIDPELLKSTGASFTVSNLGNYGVEMFTPVINLPQVGILGVNTIIPRAKDLGDGVYAFVPYIGLSLTYDHQALDGGEATRFLKDVAIAIENIDFQL
jgi:pyruvate dehydrogenase E2 component (dihydrolipoamide acetyltransferase)